MTLAVDLGLALAAGSTPLAPFPTTQLRASAVELMAMAEAADYYVQGVTSQPEKMFGIWVGKKCC